MKCVTARLGVLIALVGAAAVGRAEQATCATPKPLWTFVWISDLHVDESRRAFIAQALAYIDATLSPHFVLITGDNNALAAPPADPNHPEPLGLRRQRYFRAFLAEHLRAPYVVIPGDNWPEDFEKVFGPRQYSFDYGGIHFLLLAPDRSYHGAGLEGLSAFDEPTWAWITRDLERSCRKPTLVAIHEPICPCTFLEAPRLRALVSASGHVIAVMQGHLHADLEFRHETQTYLVAPSLGKSPVPAFKQIGVYPDALIVRTIYWDRSGGRFEPGGKPQGIGIPPELCAGVTKPPGSRLTMAGYDAMPPAAHVVDPMLAARFADLLKVLAESLRADILLPSVRGWAVRPAGAIWERSSAPAARAGNEGR